MTLGAWAYNRPPPAPKMPPGLEELMEDLTKDVLRNNPTDVYEFCANHMKKLLEIRDGRPPYKVLHLEKRIKKAQEKVRKRAEQRRQKYKQEIKFKPHIEKTEVDNTSDNDINITNTVKLVDHEKDLNASEVEIVYEPEVDKSENYKKIITSYVSNTGSDEKQNSVNGTAIDKNCTTDAANSEKYTIEQQDFLNTNISSPQHIQNEVKIESKIMDSVEPIIFQKRVNDVGKEVTLITSDKEERPVTEADTIIKKDPIILESDIPDSIEIKENYNILSNDVQSDHNNEEKNKENTNINKTLSQIYLNEVTSVKDNETKNEVQHEVIKFNNKSDKPEINIQDIDVSNSDNVNALEMSEETGNNMSNEHSKPNYTTDNNTYKESNNNMEDGSIKSNGKIKNFENEIDVQNFENVAENLNLNDLAHSEVLINPGQECSNNTNAVKVQEEINTGLPIDNQSTDTILNTVINTEEDSSDNLEPSIVADTCISNNTIKEKCLQIENEINFENVDHTESIEHINESEKSKLVAISPNTEIMNINNEKNMCHNTNDLANIVEHSTALNIDAESTLAVNDGRKSIEEKNEFKNVGIECIEVGNSENATNTNSKDLNNDTRDMSDDTNKTMDLETAAVTIQKVFRSFLFKSRTSTFENSTNDDNVSNDENADSEDAHSFISTITNMDRRTLGISRMDTVLQTVNEEKSLSLSTEDSSTLSSAATIIQAHVRGFLVRNKLNSEKTMSSNTSLINSNGLSSISLDEAQMNKNKTILNIHIVPDGNNFLSRDESMITSLELSLDGSPPSSVNLHPLSYDISEKRKQLKREDAIQSISPPSNNSGKLSDDIESLKEVNLTHQNSQTQSIAEKDIETSGLAKDDLEMNVDTTSTNSIPAEKTLNEVNLSNTHSQTQSIAEKDIETSELVKDGLNMNVDTTSTNSIPAEKYLKEVNLSNPDSQTQSIAEKDIETSELVKDGLDMNVDTTSTNSIQAEKSLKEVNLSNPDSQTQSIAEKDIETSELVKDGLDMNVNTTSTKSTPAEKSLKEVNLSNPDSQIQSMIEKDIETLKLPKEHLEISMNSTSANSITAEKSLKEVNRHNLDSQTQSIAKKDIEISDIAEKDVEMRVDTASSNSITPETVVDNRTDLLSSPDTSIEHDKKKILIKQSSDELDVVTPFAIKGSPKDSLTCPMLLHSGEFRDVVLPTRVSRSDTPVVRGE